MASAGTPPGRSRKHLVALDLEDRRFDADRRRAAIDHQQYAAREIARYGLRCRAGDAAGAIGAGGGERPAECCNQAGAEAERHAQRDRLQAGRDQIVDRRAIGQRQYQRQRAWPEPLGQCARQRIEPRQPRGHGKVRDMRDQRIEARPALGLEDLRHSRAVGGIGGEAINGLGRDGDQLTALEQRQGRVEGLALDDDVGHRPLTTAGAQPGTTQNVYIPFRQISGLERLAAGRAGIVRSRSVVNGRQSGGTLALGSRRFGFRCVGAERAGGLDHHARTHGQGGSIDAGARPAGTTRATRPRPSRRRNAQARPPRSNSIIR